MYEEILPFFKDWNDLSVYERDAYLNKWKNYKFMMEAGIPATFPFPMLSKPENIKDVKKKKKQDSSKSDQDWCPNTRGKKDKSSNYVMVDKSTCKTCLTTFRSSRLFLAHSKDCIPEQGIAGRHIQSMSDGDLADMRIMKGDRMDILKAVKDYDPKILNSKEDGATNSVPSADLDLDCTLFVNNLMNDDWNSEVAWGISGIQNEPCTSTRSNDPSPLENLEPVISIPQLVSAGATPSSTLLTDSTSTISNDATPLQNNPPMISTPHHQLNQNPIAQLISAGVTPRFTLNTNATSTSSNGAAPFLNLQPAINTPRQLNQNRTSSSFSIPQLVSAGATSSFTLRTNSTSTSTSTSSNVATPLQNTFSMNPATISVGCNKSHHIMNTPPPFGGIPRVSTCTPAVTPHTARSPLVNLQMPQNAASAASQEQLLPPENDSQYFNALNAEPRVHRLIEEALALRTLRFDVVEIVRVTKMGPAILKKLETEGFVYGPDKLALTNALTAYLEKFPPRGADIQVLWRETMALQTVALWPKLRQELHTKDDRPWHYLFNAKQNTGALANNVRILIKGRRQNEDPGVVREPVPKQKRKLVEAGRNKTKNPVYDEIDPVEYVQDVTEARHLTPTIENKQNILELMNKTYERRKSWLQDKEIVITSILEKFPHFQSFGGDVICQEFALRYPGKQSNFIRTFTTEMGPKLLKMANNEPSKYGGCLLFSNDVLNAVMVLAKLLPTPRRTYLEEQEQPLHPSCSEFFHVVSRQSDPLLVAREKVETSNYRVQPYILALGTPAKIEKMFLVIGDGKLVELGRQSSGIHAVDLLLKCYFGLCLFFPLGWKNVFRFLQIHIFHIPKENPRESDFSAQALRIKNTTL